MALKNVMIYWGYENIPYFETNNEKRSSSEDYAYAQIDNAILHGWKKEDIIVATNFDWEYSGVKNVLLKDSGVPTSRCRTCSKILGVLELLNKNYMSEDDIFWVHDFDVFQNLKFDIEQIKSNHKIGIIPTSRSDDFFTLSSFFVKKSSYDFLNDCCIEIRDRIKKGSKAHALDEQVFDDMLKLKMNKDDYIVLNRRYSYNYKCHFFQNKYPDPKFLDIINNIEFPLSIVDFNYIPFRGHTKFWRNNLNPETFELLFKSLKEKYLNSLINKPC